jgi:hypothetical protein
MKFWGLIVAFLYVLILAILLPTVGAVLVGSYPNSSDVWKGTISFWTEDPGIWRFLLVALVAEAALLTVPVNMMEKRPVTKRSIVPLVLATSFMMLVLVMGALTSLYEVFKLGNLNEWMGIFSVAVIWIFWGLMFARWSKGMEPSRFIERQCRWLFRGSILELLIAVPSHIYVRQRTECCAGMFTAIGIGCGIAVMLFSFGPGVFFLFKERIERIRK